MDYGEYTKATIKHPRIQEFLFFYIYCMPVLPRFFLFFLRFVLSCGLLRVFHNFLKVGVHFFSDKLLSSITAVSMQTTV